MPGQYFPIVVVHPKFNPVRGQGFRRRHTVFHRAVKNRFLRRTVDHECLYPVFLCQRNQLLRMLQRIVKGMAGVNGKSFRSAIVRNPATSPGSQMGFPHF